MRFFLAALMTGACLALAPCGAWAQIPDTGLEVRVNPVSGASQTLLYPGGQFLRVVPSLRQPGEAGGPVRLHMPSRRARTAASAPRAAAPRAAAATPGSNEPGAPLLSSPRPAQPARRAEAPRPQAPRIAALPSNGAGVGAGPGAAGLFGALPGAAPAGSQLASNAPSPPSGTEGLNKQGVILFGHDADAPADTAIDAIRLLAATLNNAMTRPASRIELMAYGGNKGDKGSDARRLSLKRALSIRQVLIDAGVNSARIDVHAEGGVDDTGPADRVDVYIKA